jgi:hypothetical protein
MVKITVAQNIKETIKLGAEIVVYMLNANSAIIKASIIPNGNACFQFLLIA